MQQPPALTDRTRLPAARTAPRVGRGAVPAERGGR